MSTREQFGKYLLLKKLTEDPLGETFRAGLLGGKGMEQVVLLRIFNGQGIDGLRLWQAIDGRAPLQGELKSPNLGDGVDMGEIEGIPYVAYDYVSGKNMANLLEQAARRRNFVPAEHALLITERIALGLSSANEIRLSGERVLHGFVVPHLVLISNEGETRLLGFETGPGLRSFAGNPVIRQHFGRYLSPESIAGQPIDSQDDVYSLGVLLFELLTGRPLPPPAAGGYAPVIDQAVLATEGTPIPDEIAALLRQSLVPRAERMKDVTTWHKTLNQYMFEGQYNPTTFNLAFFMHNLFRQEIEKESKEIEVEKTIPLPTVTPKSGAFPVAAPAEPVAAPAPVVAPDPSGTGTQVQTGTMAAPVQEKSKMPLLLGAAAALLLLAIGAWYFFGRGGASEETVVAETPVAVAPEPVEEEYTGPTEDELREQIAELVGQQSDLLQQQYDEQLNSLQAQLEEAKAEAEERKKREAERKAQEAEEAAAAEAAEIARLESEAAAAAAAEAEAARIAEEEAAAAAEEAAAAEAAKLAQATPAAPAPVAPPKASVRRGDLVKPGPGVVGPELIRRPQPRYPAMARRFNKTSATVQVRVLVDENGKVIKAELSGEPQKFGFDTEAVSAARRSQYKPAKKDGVPVKMWHNLVIEFRDQ